MSQHPDRSSGHPDPEALQVHELYHMLRGASYHCVHLSGDVVLIKLSDNQLWPALLYPDAKDILCDYKEKDNRSPVGLNQGEFMKAALHVSFTRALRHGKLHVAQASAALLVGIEDVQDSILVFSKDDAADLICDFDSNHTLAMGRALMNNDSERIKAFHIAFAKRFGTLKCMSECGVMFKFDERLCNQPITDLMKQFHKDTVVYKKDCLQTYMQSVDDASVVSLSSPIRTSGFSKNPVDVPLSVCLVCSWLSATVDATFPSTEHLPSSPASSNCITSPVSTISGSSRFSAGATVDATFPSTEHLPSSPASSNCITSPVSTISGSSRFSAGERNVCSTPHTVSDSSRIAATSVSFAISRRYSEQPEGQATPTPQFEGEEKNVEELPSTDWYRLFALPLPNDFTCNICGELVAGATETSCCRTVCCYDCLPKHMEMDDRCVPPECTICYESDFDFYYRSDIDKRIDNSIVFCPRGCGWYGRLTQIPNHLEFCREDLVQGIAKVDEDLLVGIDSTYIKKRAAQLVLNEKMVFREHQCSRLLREQGTQLFVIVKQHVGASYQSRVSEVKAARNIVHRYVKKNEPLLNSISGKSFGGGNHQTFTVEAWSEIMEWLVYYLYLLFPQLPSFRCCDVGCGM